VQIVGIHTAGSAKDLARFPYKIREKTCSIARFFISFTADSQCCANNPVSPRDFTVNFNITFLSEKRFKI